MPTGIYAHKQINLAGKKFGKWTVLSFAFVKQNFAYWNSRCECGYLSAVSGNSLRLGKSTQCRKCSDKRTGFILSVKCPTGHAPRTQVWCTYKNHAKERNLSWMLTQEDFYGLITSNCYYCGVKPSNAGRKRYPDFRYSGIDRVDSSSGYTKENTVSCCKFCNLAKRDLTQNEFFEWLNRIFNHNRGFMKFSTTIPDYAMSEAAFKSQPDAGTHSRGKSNDTEATLRKGALPKGTAVTDAQCVAGAARNSIDEQIGLHQKDDHQSGIGPNGFRGN